MKLIQLAIQHNKGGKKVPWSVGFLAHTSGLQIIKSIMFAMQTYWFHFIFIFFALPKAVVRHI